MRTIDIVMLVLASLALGETIGFWRGVSSGRSLGYAEGKCDSTIRGRR